MSNKEENLLDNKEGLFWDSFDFSDLYSVKEKKGIYIIVTIPNASGLIRVNEFFGKQKHTVKTSQLINLNEFCFKTTDGSKVFLNEIFNNIEAIPEEEFLNLTKNEAKMIMLPGYDANSFKDYKALKVLKIYFELKEKTKKIK